MFLTMSGISAVDQVFMATRYKMATNMTYVALQFRHNSINKAFNIINFDIVADENDFKNWYDINSTITYT